MLTNLSSNYSYINIYMNDVSDNAKYIRNGIEFGNDYVENL